MLLCITYHMLTKKVWVFLHFFGVLHIINIDLYIYVVAMSNWDNLEKLRTEVSELEKLANELKTVAETERKKKEEEIKSKAETLQWKIDELSKQKWMDAKLSAEKEKVELILKNCSDISSLESSIKEEESKVDKEDTTKRPTSSEITQTPAQPETQGASEIKEEKWFFWKTWEWIWEQWSDVWSDDKRKEQPWQNVLRVVWFGWWTIVAWYGIYRLRKRAFWKKKKEKEWNDWDSSSWENGEKKWFWDKWYGKALKWTGIWAWVGTIWYWIGKKLWLIHSDDATDSAEDQVESTIKLKENDPEKFEKYKWMWENIDSQYNQVMKKEMDTWWWGISIADGYEKYADKKNIDKDTFQATVPMCIDNQFSDVSNFLSEWWYYAYLRGLKFNELKNEIIWWWKEKIGKVLGPYLTWLTSFIPFVWKDRSEAINSWFESWEAAEREAELQLFFRQYAKVLNYTQDKLFSLKEKIAGEKFSHTEWNHSTVSDALNDDEWVENYINTDPRYKNFINGKLHQAIDIMKDNGIFNDTLSHDMEMIKSASDAERDTILKFKDWKDAIQRLESAWTNLTAENYKEWVECCDKITKDIEDEFDKSRSYLYFWFTHEAFNSKTNNVQEFLRHSWLAEMKSWLKVSLWEFKQKFASWNITKEEILLYKNQVNGYFAMKKEILIWARAIQQMKSDNPNYIERVLNVWSAIASDLLNQTGASLKHFNKWNYLSSWIAATIPLYLWWKAISIAAGTKYPKAKILWEFIKNSNIFSVVRRSKWAVMRRVYAENLNKLPVLLLKSRYNIAHGDQLLLQDLIEWKISWDNATRIIDSWNDSWLKIGGDKKAASISDFIQKMLWIHSTDASAKHLNILFNNDEGIVFMRNPSLRKMIFGEPTISSWFENVKVVRNWYRKKIYTLKDIKLAKALEDFIWWSSSTFKTLSKKQQTFAKLMMEMGNFESIEQVKSFTQNVKNYNLEWLNETKIIRLVEELIDHTDELSDTAKIEERIKQVKNIAEWDVDGAVKPAKELIDNPHYKQLLQDEIDSEIKSLEKVKWWETNNAKISQIEKQIEKLDSFKKNLKKCNPQELEWLFEMYRSFLNVGKWEVFFSNLNIIKKLLELDASAENKITDTIKRLDIDYLKDVIKSYKISNISNDEIIVIGQIFTEIKRCKICENPSEATIKALKTIVNIAWAFT